MPADAGEQSVLRVYLFLQRKHPFVSYFNRFVKTVLVSLFYVRNNKCWHCSPIPNSHGIQQSSVVQGTPPAPLLCHINTEVAKSTDWLGSCWKLLFICFVAASGATAAEPIPAARGQSECTVLIKHQFAQNLSQYRHQVTRTVIVCHPPFCPTEQQKLWVPQEQEGQKSLRWVWALARMELEPTPAPTHSKALLTGISMAKQAQSCHTRVPKVAAAACINYVPHFLASIEMKDILSAILQARFEE